MKLGFNNLRGSSSGNVDGLLHCFSEMGVLKSLDLQSNLLGQDYTSRVDFKYPTETKTPPICILTDLLMKSHSLKDLNISNNSMGGNAALSIAHGLTHT